MALMNSRYPNGGPISSAKLVGPIADDRAGIRHLYPEAGTARADLVASNYKQTSAGRSGLVNTAPTSVNRGSTVTIQYTFMNIGSANSGPFNIGFYLSTDENITTSDRLLGSNSGASASAGASLTTSRTLTIPSTVAAGTYYLGVLLDKDNTVTEWSDSNNGLAQWRPIIVNAPDPIITRQPQSRTNLLGTTATFTVAATGAAPLSYRWRKDGVALVDGGRVSGAASANLVLANVLLTDAGAYSVVVNNAFGTAVSAAASLVVTPVLLSSNVVWKYLDNGSDQGTAWRQRGFNDSAWPSGLAQLGYGDGDEATVVGYGPDPLNKYITTYFRHAFNVADPNAIPSLRLRLLRDDGAIVYLNGTEVFRNNLPGGPVDYRTLADNALDDGQALITARINPTYLFVGNNVLAVEIHQTLPTSSDLSFALELSVAPPLGPPPGLAIRLGTGNTVVLRWPNPSPDYVLQQSANMSGTSGGWTDVTQPPVILGQFNEVTLPATGQGCLFRLRAL
jgi:hypothetical protein